MASSLLVKISADSGVVIDGLALLALTEDLVQKSTAAQPGDSAGTADKPLKLFKAAHWLWAIRNYKTMAKDDDMVYIALAGRLIGGKSNCYVSDYGPVWRKGVDPGVQDPTKAEGTGVASPQALEQWKKTQRTLDPTYQTIAQRVDNPALVYNTPQMAPLEGAAAPDVRTWTSVSRTPVLVAGIRKLLEYKSLDSAPEVMAAFRQYSRLQRLLPPLVAAMFLAEPARNIRAWPINMMLLDLVQAGGVFGPLGERLNWVNTIWHPLALEVSRQNPARKDEAVPIDVFGPTGDKGGEQRKVVKVTRLGLLHLVGGAMPASPTGGGKFGRTEIGASTEKNLVTFKKGKFDYIHQKEVDVLLSWLAHVIPHSAVGDEKPTIDYDQLRLKNIGPGELGHGLTLAVTSITGKIRSRIESLIAM